MDIEGIEEGWRKCLEGGVLRSELCVREEKGRAGVRGEWVR